MAAEFEKAWAAGAGATVGGQAAAPPPPASSCSPAGVTSRQHWSWWAESLRSSPTSKVRAWRKFKNEFVAPAIKEINDLGDIEINSAAKETN